MDFVNRIFGLSAAEENTSSQNTHTPRVTSGRDNMDADSVCRCDEEEESTINKHRNSRKRRADDATFPNCTKDCVKFAKNSRESEKKDGEKGKKCITTKVAYEVELNKKTNGRRRKNSEELSIKEPDCEEQLAKKPAAFGRGRGKSGGYEDDCDCEEYPRKLAKEKVAKRDDRFKSFDCEAANGRLMKRNNRGKTQEADDCLDGCECEAAKGRLNKRGNRVKSQDDDDCLDECECEAARERFIKRGNRVKSQEDDDCLDECECEAAKERLTKRGNRVKSQEDDDCLDGCECEAAKGRLTKRGNRRKSQEVNDFQSEENNAKRGKNQEEDFCKELYECAEENLRTRAPVMEGRRKSQDGDDGMDVCEPGEKIAKTRSSKRRKRCEEPFEDDSDSEEKLVQKRRSRKETKKCKCCEKEGKPIIIKAIIMEQPLKNKSKSRRRSLLQNDNESSCDGDEDIREEKKNELEAFYLEEAEKNRRKSIKEGRRKSNVDEEIETCPCKAKEKEKVCKNLTKDKTKEVQTDCTIQNEYDPLKNRIKDPKDTN